MSPQQAGQLEAPEEQRQRADQLEAERARLEQMLEQAAEMGQILLRQNEELQASLRQEAAAREELQAEVEKLRQGAPAAGLLKPEIYTPKRRRRSRGMSDGLTVTGLTSLNFGPLMCEADSAAGSPAPTSRERRAGSLDRRPRTRTKTAAFEELIAHNQAFEEENRMLRRRYSLLRAELGKEAMGRTFTSGTRMTDRMDRAASLAPSDFGGGSAPSGGGDLLEQRRKLRAEIEADFLEHIEELEHKLADAESATKAVRIQLAEKTQQYEESQRSYTALWAKAERYREQSNQAQAELTRQRKAMDEDLYARSSRMLRKSIVALPGGAALQPSNHLEVRPSTDAMCLAASLAQELRSGESDDEPDTPDETDEPEELRDEIQLLQAEVRQLREALREAQQALKENRCNMAADPSAGLQAWLERREVLLAGAAIQPENSLSEELQQARQPSIRPAAPPLRHKSYWERFVDLVPTTMQLFTCGGGGHHVSKPVAKGQQRVLFTVDWRDARWEPVRGSPSPWLGVEAPAAQLPAGGAEADAVGAVPRARRRRSWP